MAEVTEEWIHLIRATKNKNWANFVWSTIVRHHEQKFILLFFCSRLLPLCLLEITLSPCDKTCQLDCHIPSYWNWSKEITPCWYYAAATCCDRLHSDTMPGSPPQYWQAFECMSSVFTSFLRGGRGCIRGICGLIFETGPNTPQLQFHHLNITADTNLLWPTEGQVIN